MRRTNLFGTLLLGVALAVSPLTDVAEAKERFSLSSLVGRLLKTKKSQPAAEAVEPPAARLPAAEPSPKPHARTPLPAEPSVQAQPGSTSGRLASPLSAPAPASSRPYPPLPPAINHAWLHPPEHEPDRAYSATEVLALTRNRLDRAAPRVSGPQTQVTSTSAFAELGFSPTDSPAFSAPGRLVDPVRQVNHVAKLAAPPVQSLPVQSLPVQSLPAEQVLVGNMPAEVRASVPEDSVSENAVAGSPVAEERVAEVAVTGEPVAENSVAIESIGQRASPLPARAVETADRPREISPTASRSLPPVFQKVRGRVAAIDWGSGIIRVDLLEQESLPAGSKIRVYHANGTGEPIAVHIQVLDSVAGVAAGKLMDGATLDSIAPGDKIMAWKAASGR